MSDLHQQMLAALDGFDDALAEPGGLLDAAGDVSAALRAVVELCVSHQADAVGGGLTDVDTLWPSDVLQAIARELDISLPTPEKENPDA